VRLDGLAGPGGARGRDDHDVLRLQETGREAGAQGEQGTGRVAARHRDAGGAAELLALAGALGVHDELRQPVRPGPGVRGPVELVPLLGGVEPVVGAGVDHHGLRRQLRGDRGRGAVRQGEEDDVVAGEVLHRGVDEHPVGEGVQVRLQLPQPLARVGMGPHGPDLDLRVTGEDPQDLATGVAGCPRHCCAERHRTHSSSKLCMVFNIYARYGGRAGGAGRGAPRRSTSGSPRSDRPRPLSRSPRNGSAPESTLPVCKSR
jgi:hypothetical protein